MNFLNLLGETYNITLFHYRNHGAATGDVLAGFEIADSAEIEGHLEALGYPYQLVSGNSSYRTFLTGDPCGRPCVCNSPTERPELCKGPEG